MKRFVVSGHEASVDPDFPLDDLPGAGRMDLLARTVNAAFTLSHDLRRDVTLDLVLNDTFTVRFNGAELQGLNPDERSIAGLIKKALDEKDTVVGGISKEVTPGVEIYRKNFEDNLNETPDDRLYRLSEDGTPIEELDINPDPCFVLSDHQNFTQNEEKTLEDASDVRISPKTLHTDHTVTVVYHYLDRRI